MSLTVQNPDSTPRSPDCPPDLQNGDRLTLAEFERRYTAMAHVKKAELIEGEVYMGSPVSFFNHAQPHADMIGWLSIYRFATVGVASGDNGTLVLDLDNEVQPDAFLLIEPAAGGQIRVGEDGFIHGAPELVVEIAASTVSIDMNRKLNAYRRNGVSEYIVWRVQDREIDWFVLRNGVFEKLSQDSEGLLCSETFPGLVLDPTAMIAGDHSAVVAAQVAALGSPAHAEFVERLSHALGRDSA